MSYDAYLAQCTDRDSQLFIQKLKSIVGEKDLMEALNDESIVTDIFYSEQSAGISSRYFYRSKKTFYHFVSWLQYNGYIDNAEELVAKMKSIALNSVYSSDDIAESYFGGYNEMIKFIDQVGSMCIRKYKPVDTNNIKAAVTLMWVGLSVEEAITIGKWDVRKIVRNNKIKYVIQGNVVGRIIYLTKEQYDILTIHRTCKCYKGLPQGTTINYKNGEFLMKGKYEGGLRKNAFIRIIHRFNEVLDQNGANKKIRIWNLRRNAAFETIYNDKSRGVVNGLMKLLNCDKMRASCVKNIYDVWEKVYHPEA